MVQTLDDFFIVALWVIGVAAALVVLILVVSRLRRQRLLNRALATMSGDQILDFRGCLLEAIQAKSSNQRTPVLITHFWKKAGLSWPQRSAIVQPLIDAGIVFEAPTTYTNDFTRLVADAWNDFFCIPPTTLILSDQDWRLMVESKMAGRKVVIERMTVTVDSHDTNNTIDSGGGPITGVAQSGRDAKSKVGNVGQEGFNVSSADLSELALALRFDARFASDAGIAARINTLAELFEQEKDEPNSDLSRKNLFERLTDYVTKYGDAMSTTVRLLSTFGFVGDRT